MKIAVMIITSLIITAILKMMKFQKMTAILIITAILKISRATITTIIITVTKEEKKEMKYPAATTNTATENNQVSIL